MQTRLHSKYPALADAILAAPAERRRLMVRAAGTSAAEKAGLDAVMRGEVIAAINGAKAIDDATRACLETLQWESDQYYLKVSDSLAARESLPAEAMTSFMRARAVAAILLAVADRDDAGTATDVVYETLACGSDRDALLSTIERIVQA
jgi:hypothetical protein